MNKSIALLANNHILKPLSEILKDNGYHVTQQLPVLTIPIINKLALDSPELIFLSEEVECDDDLTIIEAIGQIKAKANPRFIIQTKPRKIGDNFLSDLVSLVVYDFLPKSEFNIQELLELIEHPKDYQQVKEYHNLTRRIYDFPLGELPEGVLTEIQGGDVKKQTQIFKDWIVKNLKFKSESIKRQLFFKPPEVEQNVLKEAEAKKIINNPFKHPKKVPPNSFQITSIPIREANAKRLQEEILRVKPQHVIKKVKEKACVITVIGSKTNVGSTTIAVNLLRFGGVLLTTDKREWSVNIKTIYLETFQALKETIVEKTANHEIVVIDAGAGNFNENELISLSQKIVIVSDNQKDASRLIKHIIDKVPPGKKLLVLNKAITSGTSPNYLSEELHIPIGIVIPMQNGYKRGFGLDLPRGPWEVLFKKIVSDY